MYKLYRVADKMEHYGINLSLSTEILNFLCERSELISLMRLVVNSSLDNLCSKPRCHTVSKTFSISKNITAVEILLLKLRFTLFF
jgi:hypothetical protein